MHLLKPKQEFEEYEVLALIRENGYSETYKVVDIEGKTFSLKLYIKDKLPPRQIDLDGEVHCIKLYRYLYADAIPQYITSSKVLIEEVGECFYVVTEYYEGELLEEKLNREGTLLVQEAVNVFKGIVQGLDYLHSQYPPLIHNDITPRNILLMSNGRIKFLDMGHLSYVKNNPSRPPFDTDDLDFRYHSMDIVTQRFNEKTDIFSATAVLYHMLFGVAPWNPKVPENGEWMNKMSAVLKQRIDSGELDLSSVVIPDELKAIIRKGMAWPNQQRYDHTKQLTVALDNYLSEYDT